MKKSVKKKRVVKTRVSRRKFDIKKTLPFRLLVIFIIILLALLLIKILLNVEKISDSDLSGELGSLKWDFSKVLSHAAEVETIYGKSN